MADLFYRILRVFLQTNRPGVAHGTHAPWPEEHPSPKELTDARLRFALGLLISGFLFFCPALSSAQEVSGPLMIARSESGASASLPLFAEELKIEIDQGHATTEFLHTFQNETKDNLEGRYQISLGTIATATGFSYWNGKQRIVGEIFEKSVAEFVYQSVTGTGRDPGLLEQTGEGTFAFRVAPILPGEKKRVQVQTAEWLRQTEDQVEYRAPLGKSGKGATILLKDSRKIQKVWSPTHHLTIETKGNERHIRVGEPAGKPDALVLRYRINEAPFALSTAVHRSKGHDAYAVVSISTPKGLTKQKSPRDITLVVDRSGSMTGTPLEAARRATEGVISRLDASDYVNVVQFDDGVDALFPEPKRVADVRDAAKTYVSSITAGGGTDIALALKEALSRQKPSGRSQIVLFLTDGQSDSQSALSEAKKAPSGVRLYTVGIGSGVDRALLSRLARDNRGRFTYVADEKNLERDVEHLFSRIEAPTLSDIKIELDGATMQRVYPRSAPDLFGKDQLTFAMRMKPAASNNTARLIVTAKRDGKKQVFEKKVSLSPVNRPWVGRLWGQSRVDDLLEQISLNGETPELQKETIELALAYSLVTRYTSFLAIPESEITGQMAETMANERARRAEILKKHKDAAALSRSLMPPGDPVITVRAPQNAQGVTAVFPFGLTLDLSYDPKLEAWQGRFLVPNDVPDGPYDVQVFITDRDGTVTLTTTTYEIDSIGPAFEVGFTIEPRGVRIAVSADEALRETRVILLGAPGFSLRVDGKDCGPDGCQLKQSTDTNYDGKLELPAGTYKLRIIATDKARNETVRVVEVVVPVEEC